MATIVCLNKQAPYGPMESTERQSKEGEMEGEDCEQTTQNNHLSLSLSLCVCVCVCVYLEKKKEWKWQGTGQEILCINPLKPELNPICYLLALLAHHFLHVSRIRIKSLTIRLLMSYIYIEHLFLMFLDHTQRRSTVGRTPLDE